MVLPAKSFRFSLAFTLATAGGAAANAQSLNQSYPLVRLSEVAQFGIFRDAKFVFCDSGDCPERSIKHLYVSPPLHVQEELIMPAPQSIPAPLELLHAKVPTKMKLLKKTRD